MSAKLSVVQLCKTLPGPLILLIAGLVAIPLCGYEVMRRTNLEWDLLRLCAYVFLPVTALLMVLIRSAWFLPVYALNVILLGVMAWQHFPLESLRPPIVATMVAIAVVFGFALSTKDVLAPFLARKNRGWRVHRRLRGNKKMTLLAGDRRIPLVTEDASLSGLRVYGAHASFRGEAPKKGKVIRLSYRIDTGSRTETHTVRAVVRWTEDVEPFFRFGVEFLHDPFCAKGAAHLVRFPATTWIEQVNKYWAMAAFRWTIVALWISSIGATLGMPACGTNSAQDRDVIVVADFDNQFALMSPETVAMQVQGCQSKHTEQLTFPADYFRLYRHDRDCVVVITQIVLGGESYVVQSGSSFNPSEGAITTFVGTSGHLLYVVVTKQLPPLLDGTAISVSFQFHSTQIGNAVLVSSPKNIVSVETLVSEAMEGDSIQIRFFKVSDISSEAFSLFYSLSGDVLPVTGNPPEGDYYGEGNEVMFPAGATELILTINTFNDNIPESNEALRISIEDSTDYFHYGHGMVLIKDDDGSIVTKGLVGWLHPDTLYNLSGEQLTVAGMPVETWADDSGLPVSHDAAAAGSINTTTGVNGHLALQFSESSLLGIADSGYLNTGGPYPQKTLLAVFETGSDVNSRQVIYEEGGSTKGYNLYIDSGHLYVSAWDTKSGWLARVKRSVAPQTSYLSSLQIDTPAGEMRAYLYGELVGTAPIGGALDRHRDDIAIGGIRGSTLFHDGQTGGSVSFSGSLNEIILYSYDTESQIDAAAFANELQATHLVLLDKYGFNHPVLSISSDVLTIDERTESTAYVTISRQNIDADALNIVYEVTGTATSGTDFVGLPGEVSIPPYETSVTFPVSALNDTDIEGTETINIQILPSTSYSLNVDTISLSILDGESFTPPPGITLWLDASQGVNATSVSSWTDLTGIHTATQNSKAKQPQLATSPSTGQAEIAFDGKDDFLTIASHGDLDAGGPYGQKAIAVAFRTSQDVTSRQVIYEQGDASRGLNLIVDNGLLYFVAWNLIENAWGSVAISSPITAGAAYAVVVEFDKGAKELRMHRSDMPMTVAAHPSINDIFAHAGGISVGGPAGKTLWHDNTVINSANFSGTIAEIMLFNNVLGEAAAQNVLDHLAETHEP